MKNNPSAGGPRSVTAQTISDSLVITGDFAQITTGEAPIAARLAPVLPQPPRVPDWDDTAGARLLDILDPASAALPFLGRDAMLADLLEWLDDPAGVSVHAVTGPAGIGKSRLAIQLCHAALARTDPRWIAGFVAPAEISAVGSLLATSDISWPLPCLLVVDYAILCAPALGQWLDHLGRRTPRQKLRLLLLERDADPNGLGWWHDLAGSALHGGQRRRALLRNGEPAVLGALDALEDRRQVMQAALAAARAHLPGGDAPDLPAAGECPSFDMRLRRRRFASPLALVMAGLIARDRGPGAALSLRHLDSARLLGRREIDRLVAFAGIKGVPEPTARLGLMLHLLTGGLPVAAVHATLAAMLAPHGQAGCAPAVAHVLEQCFPPRPGMGRTLSVIQPDLIGSAAILEGLSATSMLGADATAVIRQAYAQAPAGTSRVLVRLAQDFAFAAETRGSTTAERTVAREVLGWLETLARSADNPPDLAPLAAAMPPRTTVLRTLAAEIAGTLSQYHRARLPADPAAAIEAATWTNHLAIRLSDLGYGEAALAAAEEAVRLRRALLASAPASPLADLAKALNTLAAMQSESLRPDAALASAEEARTLYRALAAAQPDTFGPDLAMSLSNHAALLTGAARREAAWAAGQEATVLYRRLAAREPDMFTPDLAMSLNNSAVTLTALDRPAAARQAAEEAVRLYRTLADERPDAFTPDLATALETLGGLLAAAGEAAQARSVFAEAIARLTPAFTTLPLAFRARMDGFVDAYRAQCAAAGQPADEELLAPVMDQFSGHHPIKRKHET